MRWFILMVTWMMAGCLVGGAMGAGPAAGRQALGVYTDVGLREGIRRTNNFEAWVGVPVQLGHDSMPTVATWDHLRGEDWLLGPWAKWKKEKAGRRLVLSVAILPGNLDLQGPDVGPKAHQPVSLEAGARGEYNDVFRMLGENLVRLGLEDSYLRLGWEMNGNWYTWRAGGHEEAYAGYWRQIVKTIRSVPGTGNLKFVFNPDCDPGQCQIEKAWPGDEYVDFLGIDIYDDSWLPDTYPYPDTATAEEILARQKRVWEELHLRGNDNHRLLYWRDMARAHGKPLCFPEWGVCGKQIKDNHGGGDDPYFVEQMYRFCMDEKNNVAWQSYFDCSIDQNTDHRISPEPDGSYKLHFPRSSAKYRELFGAPMRP